MANIVRTNEINGDGVHPLTRLCRELSHGRAFTPPQKIKNKNILKK